MRPAKSTRRWFLSRGAQGLGMLAAISASPGALLAADTPSQAAEALIARGVAFLRARQDEKGGWSTRREPGITGLVVTGLLRSGQVVPGDPAVTKALAYLEGSIGPNGGVSEDAHANYATSIALLAFQEANRNGKYDRIIKSGQDFLKGKQWDESEGKGRDDPFYGGAGYGGKNSRPDLSNTTFLIDALRETGLPPDDPSIKKAMIFVSRCQNLKGEFNDQEWAGKVNDGGFVYSTAHSGETFAGKTPDGGLRSYASMTYAGLKSMIYAGLDRDDPRVKAAMTYIKDHYTLDENPGLGQQGLYYYYHTFAKTMKVLGESKVIDSKGGSHDWRAELIAALKKREQPDGGWVNPSDRFLEGDPNLVTAYALLALAYTRQKS